MERRFGNGKPFNCVTHLTTTYTVTGTTSGCTDTANITSNVNPDPMVNISASANPICAGTSTTLTASGGTTYSWSGGLGTANPLTVSPATATTYTVTGTTSGCTGSASITINMNSNLAINISASANPICAGTSNYVNSQRRNNLFLERWVGNGKPFNVSPAIATTYTVTGTSSGCTGYSEYYN